MGFYIQALREDEEFMGNVGFNDDLIGQAGGEYAAELDDIAQVIKDVNVDYAEQSSQEELDGQDIAEDPVEECAMALYESEYNWNLIWKAMATKEIHEAATGKQSVMTENAVTDFFKKVKEFFVKLFKKIAAFFKNWMDNFLVAFRTNDSFIKKYGSKLSEGKKAFEDLNKSFKGYDFNKASKREAAIRYIEGIKTDSDELNAIKSFKEKAKNTITGKILPYYTSIEGEMNNKAGISIDRFRGELCGEKNTITESDFRDKLREAYFGSIDKEELNSTDGVMQPNNIISVLKKGKKTIEDTKKIFKGVKNFFDSAVRICNDIEKSIVNIKDGDTTTQTKVLKAAKNLTESMKDRRTACSTAFSMCLKSMKAEISQARKIGNAYIFSLNKSKRKDKIEKLSDSTFLGGIQMI